MASIFKRKGALSYHIEFNDTRGQQRRLLGFKDKTATKELAAKIERAVAIRQGGGVLGGDMLQWLEGLRPDVRDKLAEWGVIDPQRAAAGKGILEHVKEWTEVLAAKGNTERHVTKYRAKVSRLIIENNWKNLTDISAVVAQRWLGALRDSGSAANTLNDYVRAMKSCCKWLVMVKRMAENPLAHITTFNARGDRRLERRGLTPREIVILLTATEAGKQHHGMTGRQRTLLYRLAIETGLRWSELRSLTKASFDLDGEYPNVTIKPEDEKAGRGATLNLRAELTEALKEYLTFQPSDARAFPMWIDKGADMIRRDMEAAGLSVKDEHGKVIDFHALRHTLGSLLAAAGIHPKVAQEIMRHSTIDLTMNMYTHTLLESRKEALDKLPGFQQQPDNSKGDSTIAEAE